MIFLLVSLRRVASNTSEQRSRSGLCKRVIRREATETEGLVFITSQDLRKSLTALGHSAPKFITSIRELVIQYGQQLRPKKKTRKIANHKSEGKKFALTLDEWTSLGNRRYLNINVHRKGYLLNNGLVRDIVGITTDGCAMMKKLGRIISIPTIMLRTWTPASHTRYIRSKQA